MDRIWKFLTRKDSLPHLIKHIVFIGIIVSVVLLGFFYMYLPVITNHGEAITVPDIVGLHYDDLEEFLTDRSLRFEVMPDSDYTSEYAPLSVLKQYPEAGMKVKEDRKIFLTLNAINPPEVRMPRLIDGSLKNAEMQLESYGLIRGEIIYKPDPVRNAVLDQLYQGESIEEGTPVPKGAQIDLVVGDGIGRQVFEMPDATGMIEEEARILILGSSLKVGEINYIESEDQDPGIVVDQNPVSGRMVRVGTTIDLWVSKPTESDTLNID